MLNDYPLLIIHLVPFSTDAYDSFYRNHADIVILDTSVLLPYENIIEQFKQCRWNYTVLLLSNNKQQHPDEDQCLYLDNNYFNKKMFANILNHIVLHTETMRQDRLKLAINWHGTHHLEIHPDTYCLAFIKTYANDQSITKNKLQQFTHQATTLCMLTEIFHTQNEALFYISRSSITKDFSLNLLGQLSSKLFGLDSAFIYQRNINWQQFGDHCLTLKHYQNYSVFFSGKIINLSERSGLNIHNLSLNHLNEQCHQLLKALLTADSSLARHLLQYIYLHLIKNSWSMKALVYVRTSLEFWGKLIHTPFDFSSYRSVESELDGLLQSPLLLPLHYQSSSLQKTLTATVLSICKNYASGWSLDQIAQDLCLNKIYLTRVFKQQFNYTILETIQMLRLLYAKYYLIFSKRTVSDISELLGFASVGYFSKFFKNNEGCTAMEFRKNNDLERELYL
ncbi:helix-turn-helix transcriptional regulator [Sporolactobacillus kofuensis]|uniref:Helix-turn-helix transcriptional regulator n=1 Tax=Sporolactobacillus kofuensis TaxID=269672 RepID=A0ABW1WE78_9BACL|nr:helix-turn-helix transcriptional regulator [Sporolactobacillus kofuensis]MCO7175764.1 helix-turn-helix transcriptional regulator [Sporolactobacillus kofuensis]